MKFREETIKQFNSYRDTTLNKGMLFFEAVKNIEDANNCYFYVSLNKRDVINAIEKEKEFAEQLELDLIYIVPLGIAIALQL